MNILSGGSFAEDFYTIFFVPGDSGIDIWRRTDISRVKTGGGGES